MNNFLWLEQWFHEQCNGAWEHAVGIRIETLDNPGWHVRIALQGTPYDGLPNAEIKRMQQNEEEWMTCRIVAGTFDGTGGPLMLGPIIQTFRNWIETVGV